MSEEEILKQNGELIAEIMRDCGYPSILREAVNSPLGETYYFDLINPLQYDKNAMAKAVEKASVIIRVDMALKPTKKTHYSIFVANAEQDRLSLYQLLHDSNWQHCIIGVDENGQSVILDFDKIPHLLIAGTTGSGKSILLHNLLVNLSSTHAGRKKEFIIIDPKGSEFREYKNTRGTTFCDNTARAIELLGLIEKEMDRRYTLFDPMSTHDIFVIIDELADLMLTSKFAVEQSIVRLAQKGRACGIHLIVATQRPTIDVCSGLIKANMPYRIGLKTASVRDSVVILDHKGCETLKGNGDCIVKLGLKEYHTKIAYPERELENQIIKDYAKR